jgi:hypothetical protein
MAENVPGNGSDSPFGNGEGAVTGVPPATGGHDFLQDPASNAPASGGRDFTKETYEQKTGSDPVNPQSVPSGGTLPFTGEPAPLESPGSPFRITGG